MQVVAVDKRLIAPRLNVCGRCVYYANVIAHWNGRANGHRNAGQRQQKAPFRSLLENNERTEVLIDVNTKFHTDTCYAQLLNKI